jgi:hypothetical protein
MNKLNELADAAFIGNEFDKIKFAELIIADLKDMLKLHGSHFDWVSVKFEGRLLRDIE